MIAVPFNTLRVARAASRRAVLADMLRFSGMGLTVGAALGLAVVLASKLAGQEIAEDRWALVLAAPLAAAVVIALVFSFVRVWGVARAARELDHRLGLRDSLGSAVALVESGREDPFIQVAIAQAELMARSVSTKRAIIIKPRWVWAVWPLLVGIAVVVILYVPGVQSSRRRIATNQAEATADAVSDIQSAAAAVQQTPIADDPLAARRGEELLAIENELSSGRLDPDAARAKAAKSIESAADRIDERSQQQQLKEDAVRMRLAQAASQDDSQKSSLASALSTGDVESAARAAEEMQESAPLLSGEERARLAAELELLANLLDQRPGSGSRAQPSGGASSAEPMTNQHSPQPQGASDPSDVEGSVPTDSDQNVTPLPEGDSPRDLMPPAADSPVEEDVKQVREALREAAEQLRREPKAPASPTPQTPPDARQPQGESARPPARSPQPQRDSGQKQDPGKQGGEASPPPAGEQRESRPGGDQRQSQSQRDRTASEKQTPSDQPKPPSDSSQQQKTPQQTQPGGSQQKSAGEQTKSQSQPGESSDQTQGRPGSEQKSPSDPKADPNQGQPTQGGEQPQRPPGTNPDHQQGQPEGGAQAPDANQSKDPAAKTPGDSPAPQQQPQPGQTGPQRPEQSKGTQPQPAETPRPSAQPKSTDPSGTQGPPSPEVQPQASPKPSQGPPASPHQGKQGEQSAPRAEDSAQKPAGAPQSQPPASSQEKLQERPQRGETQPSKQQRQAKSSQGDEQDRPDQQPAPGPAQGPQKPEAGEGKPKPSPVATPQSQSEPNQQEPRDTPQTLPDLPKDTEGLEKLAKQLKDMAKRSEQIDQSKKDSRRMRRQAEELLKNASPEQLKQLERLAREFAKDQPPQGGDEQQSSDSASPIGNAGDENEPRTLDPGATPRQGVGSQAGREQRGPVVPPRRDLGPLEQRPSTPVDARRPGSGKPRDRVIAEWNSDRPVPRDGSVARGTLAEGVRDAAAGAERAIEQQQVPGQYSDLVRRVFQRYVDRVGAPKTPPAPALPEAADAPAKPR